MATYTGKGIVWDPNKNKPLCNLNNGPFVTEDKDEQELMRNAGYKGDFLDEYVIIDDEEPTEEELRDKAKELGIASYWNKKLDTLKLEIAEKEGA